MSPLFNLQQFNLEDQHALRRNRAIAIIAIAQLVGYVQSPFVTFLHQHQRFTPALDHLVYRKLQWLVTLETTIEFRAIDKGTPIVNDDTISSAWRCVISGLQNLILQSRSRNYDALLFGILS